MLSLLQGKTGTQFNFNGQNCDETVLLIREPNSRTVPFEYWALLRVFTNVMDSVKLSNILCKVVFSSLTFLSVVQSFFVSLKIYFFHVGIRRVARPCVERLFFSTQNSAGKSTHQIFLRDPLKAVMKTKPSLETRNRLYAKEIRWCS